MPSLKMVNIADQYLSQFMFAVFVFCEIIATLMKIFL